MKHDDELPFSEAQDGLKSLQSRVRSLEQSMAEESKAARKNDFTLQTNEQQLFSQMEDIRSGIRNINNSILQFKHDLKLAIFTLRRTAPSEAVSSIQDRIDSIKFEQFLRSDQAERIIRDVMRK